MSLETVVEDIREEARERAVEIRNEGDERADEIIAEAERVADEIVDDAKREADRRIEQERDQKLSSANLEAKQARLEARRDVLESVRESVEERIAGIDGERREDLTRALLDDAASEFEGGEVSVRGRADDADLIEEILTDYDGFQYDGEYDCLGGVVVESEASRLRVNNTFDSVLETVWDDALRDISARLFESESAQ